MLQSPPYAKPSEIPATIIKQIYITLLLIKEARVYINELIDIKTRRIFKVFYFPKYPIHFA